MQNNARFSFLPKGHAAWLCALAALCLNFSPLLFNFIWGNHDWLPLNGQNSWLSGLIEGRLTQYIFLNILLGGNILPFLNTFLGFIAYTAALTLLFTRFFKFSSPAAPLLITAAATLPYITEIVYFQYLVLSQLLWPLVIVFALLAAQKAATTPSFLKYTVLSALLLFFAVSGYPASVNLYITAAILWIINNCQKDSLKPQAIIRTAFPFAISLITALILLLLAYRWLKQNHYMLALYNSQPKTLAELFLSIPGTIKSAALSLLTPQPFLPLSLKILITAAVIAFAVMYLKSAVSKKDFTIRMILLLALPLCAKFSTWLAADSPDNPLLQYDPAAFMVRTDFYAIPCLTGFCLCKLAALPQKICKNISAAIATIILLINFNANLAYCKTNLLGFKAENLLLERLISRIEQHPRYLPRTPYTIVQAGELPLRPRYYTPASLFEKYGYYTLKAPFSRHWIAFEYYNFYAPAPFVREGTAINSADITPQMINFFTAKISPWPAPDSVYVDNRYAVIALTPEGKKMLTSQFNLLK